MDFTKVQEALKSRGFAVSTFDSAAAAADYLVENVKGKSVAFGGSMTLEALNMFERLGAVSEVWSHWHAPEGMTGPEVLKKALGTEIYLTSVNGLAETGELINIDGTGNRLGSSLYGHKKVYFVVGRNKIAPTYDEALWRARNIAAPKNAQRLGAATPCAAKGDKCYDCDAPGRICRGLTVLWRKMRSCEMEVVLGDEDLGY